MWARAAPRWLTNHDRVSRFVTQVTNYRTGCARRELDQRLSARRPAEEILDLVAIGARELQFMTALEGEEVLTVHVGAQALDQAQVDDGRTVHALKQLRIQYLLELLHRATQDVSVAASVDAHVVPGRVDPLDRGDLHTHGLASLADRQYFRTPSLDGAAAVRKQLIERKLPAAGDLRNDLQEPVALVSGAPGAHVLAHARKGGGEARFVDRFEEVVDGVCFEGLDGVLIVGSNKHHYRQ